MNTRSRKAKGRNLQNAVRDLLIKHYGWALVEDIHPAIMGESGRDIKLSPLAERKIPFDIECKNCESLNIWSALKQTEENTKDGRIPLLIFKRNHTDIYACIKFERLLELL